ncbi:hypothetical protein TNCV_2829231 [Trichonephila clavipes]|nr:hypothetical protein TNCV_2829231 [Trichonephila clavipes]
MDETPYSNLLKMIKIDAVDFYKNSARDFNWGDLTNDTVMHISCGLGDLSEKLLEIFPNIKKIVDIDFMNSNDEHTDETTPDTCDEFHEGVIIKGGGRTFPVYGLLLSCYGPPTGVSVVAEWSRYRIVAGLSRVRAQYH